MSEDTQLSMPEPEAASATASDQTEAAVSPSAQAADDDKAGNTGKARQLLGMKGAVACETSIWYFRLQLM